MGGFIVSRSDHERNNIFTEDKRTERNYYPEEDDLEERYKKYINILKNLTIMSDVFMRNVFKKRDCVEYVLQVIMGKNDLKIRDHVVQKDYKNLQGRSAILDCVARDKERKIYDVEIQQESEGASPKRSRYHSGLMDMNTLKAGKDFEKLPESWVIFVTTSDILEYGMPVYHIERKISGTDKTFNDDSHILYVNSNIQDETELGRLMHDFHCKDAKDMYSPILAQRVRELKETQKGVEIMCREMDNIFKEGVTIGEIRGEKIGFDRGKLSAQKENAIAFSRFGLTVEQIAQAMKVSVEDVRKWISEGMEMVKQ